MTRRYDRIQGERRTRYIERLAAEEIDPLSKEAARGKRNEIKAIAEDVARGRRQPSAVLVAYVEGFARGLLEDGDAYTGAGDHPDRNKHNHLGYCNGMNTRRILAGALPATTASGTAR